MRDRNQSLLKQTKKLKNDKRLLQEKLGKLTNKEVLISEETTINPIKVERVFGCKNPNLGERNQYRSNQHHKLERCKSN